jgi:Prenyltransferase and squalene oxidase repeat
MFFIGNPFEQELNLLKHQCSARRIVNLSGGINLFFWIFLMMVHPYNIYRISVRPAIFVLSILALLTGLLGICTFTHAAVSSDLSNQELTPQIRSVVKRGLDWLAQNQGSDGSFQSGGSAVAITALAGLAFVAGGNLPNQGPYAHQTAAALQYVLNQCQQSGLIVASGDGSPMYGHGFATLFLAEVYGESDAPDLRGNLEKAVRLIVQTQNADGGWRYQPVPMDADLSVTICQVMALRAARNAGIFVPVITINKAISFVHRLQNSDGGFSYMLEMPGSAFPRSAAGVALLQYAGVYNDPAIARGLAYLHQCLPGTIANSQDNYYYGNYYGTQAMFLAGGQSWTTWWLAISDDLIKRQQPDGSWNDNPGQSYATAMALIILQIPNRLLPILQR